MAFLHKFPRASAVSSRPPQQGVVLVVVLIFMLALSTLAIFSARNATLGERQARNELDFQVARQAAEAALRDAERDLMLDGVNVPKAALCTTPRGGTLRAEKVFTRDTEFTPDCLRGQCDAAAARYLVTWANANTTTRGEPWWPTTKGGNWTATPATASTCTTFTGGVPLGLFTGTPALPGVVQQPEYLIEYLTPKQDAGAENKSYKCPTEVTPSGTGRGLASLDATGTASASIEEKPCFLFRVTARGFGRGTRGLLNIPSAEVVLQSYFSIIKP